MAIQSMKSMQTVLDYLEESVVIHSFDTSIVYANKAASKQLGLSKDELQTKNAYDETWEFVDEKGDILKIEDYPVNIAIKSKKSFSNYVVGKKYEDYVMWFNVSGSFLVLDDEVDYIIITFNNITELKTKNEELELYKQIFENADTGITVVDMNKKDNPLILANEEFYKITGYKVSEVIGKNCRFLQGKDRDQEGRIIVKDSIKKELPCEVELKNYKQNGTLFYNLLNLTPLFDKEKKLKYYIGIQHDITKQKRLEDKFRKLLNTQDNIVILSNEKEMEYANDKFLEFFGYKSLEQFQSQYRCICDLFIPNDNFFHMGKMDDEYWITAMLKLEQHKRVVSLLKVDFSVHAFSVGINIFEDNNYIVTFTNISKTMLEKIELLKKTLHDKLTGAFNREYFDSNYKRLIKEYHKDEYSLAIGLLDIDHFKIVNDTYGHDVGDEVLIKFVQIIQQYSRKDDLLIRWGGEEFILVLKVKSNEDLQKALDHLRKVIEIQAFPVIGKKTCSIGGSIFNKDESIEKTIKRADEAVYKAKNSGRNKVIIL